MQIIIRMFSVWNGVSIHKAVISYIRLPITKEMTVSIVYNSIVDRESLFLKYITYITAFAIPQIRNSTINIGIVNSIIVYFIRFICLYNSTY